MRITLIVLVAVVLAAVAAWIYNRDTQLYIFSAMDAAQRLESAPSDEAYTQLQVNVTQKLDALTHRMLFPSQQRAVAAIAQYLEAVDSYRTLATPFLYRIQTQPYDDDEAKMICRWAMYGNVLGDWNSKYLVITNGEKGTVMRRYSDADRSACQPAILRLRTADAEAYQRYLRSLSAGRPY